MSQLNVAAEAATHKQSRAAVRTSWRCMLCGSCLRDKKA